MYTRVDAALLEPCLIGPRHPLPTDGVLPTVLYPKNNAVRADNAAKLQAIAGPPTAFQCKDKLLGGNLLDFPSAIDGVLDDSISYADALLKYLELSDTMSDLADENVETKIGAQVMLTRN